MWNEKVISYDFADCFLVNDYNITVHKLGLVNLHSVFDTFKKNSSFQPEYALKTLGWSNNRLGEVERIYYDGLAPCSAS